MKNQFAIYYTSFKILLKKENSFLFLKDFKNFWDLPGGRVDINEVEIPILKVIKREVKEELGSKIKYFISGPIIQYRRHCYNEIGNLNTIYEGEYISGLIKLSLEHKSYHWIDLEKMDFKQKNFRSKEEYKVFINYFNKNN